MHQPPDHETPEEKKKMKKRRVEIHHYHYQQNPLALLINYIIPTRCNPRTNPHSGEPLLDPSPPALHPRT